MTRAEIAALLASSYIGVRFLWLRVRLYRQRSRGLPLELLRRFDLRALWDPMLPPPEAAAERGAPAPNADHPLAPRAYRRSPWELAEPPAHGALRDALFAGETPRACAGDRAAAALMTHVALRRVLANDLDGAAALARQLDPDDREAMLAAVEVARAEAHEAAGERAAARRAADLAQEHAGRIRRDFDPAALDYLFAHLRLCWRTHPANLELSVALAQRRIRRALRAGGDRPYLHLASAHAHALLGQESEAVDAIGRALYHAQGDRFYARIVLDSGYLARARPALVAQCRALLDAQPPAAAAAPRPPFADPG